MGIELELGVDIIYKHRCAELGLPVQYKTHPIALCRKLSQYTYAGLAYVIAPTKAVLVAAAASLTFYSSVPSINPNLPKRDIFGVQKMNKSLRPNI